MKDKSKTLAEGEAVLRHLLAYEVAGADDVPISLATLAKSPCIDPTARAAFEALGLVLTEPHVGRRATAPDGRYSLFVYPYATGPALLGTRWHWPSLADLIYALPGAYRRQRMFNGGLRRYGPEVPLGPYLGERPLQR